MHKEEMIKVDNMDKAEETEVSTSAETDKFLVTVHTLEDNNDYMPSQCPICYL
jgi:hypothetical protein